MIYTEKLKYIIEKKKSNLIVGLDPDIRKIPEIFLKFKNPVLEFNKAVINASKEIVAGYKFNIAFYEVLMGNGMDIIAKSLSFIPRNCVTICDAKRGDIPNTSEMYAKTYFDNFCFDAVTLSPYMGLDSTEPFLKRKNKFAYILALTSNKGSSDFQKIKSGNSLLFEIVVKKYLKMYGTDLTGFVFGANHLSDIKRLTKKNQNLFLLIPGIGAQGNDLQELIFNLCNDVFVINSSRSIIYCSQKNITLPEFTKHVKNKSTELNSLINQYKTQHKK
ncbi:MAG TPA: orotidine-5'-phosphate decarboxylase [Ignavibacteria bacterium]